MKTEYEAWGVKVFDRTGAVWFERHTFGAEERARLNANTLLAIGDAVRAEVKRVRVTVEEVEE